MSKSKKVSPVDVIGNICDSSSPSTICSAVPRIMSRTSVVVSCRPPNSIAASCSRATAPAICGDAILVPALSPKPSPGTVLVINAPGAKIMLSNCLRWLNPVIAFATGLLSNGAKEGDASLCTAPTARVLNIPGLPILCCVTPAPIKAGSVAMSP